MLIIGILISTDKRNGPASPCLVPLALFFTILGIGLGLGLETGWAVNPARDLGPRILTAMVGYGKAGMHFVLHIGSVAHSSLQSLTIGANTGSGARSSVLSWACRLELWPMTPLSTPAPTVFSTSRTC